MPSSCEMEQVPIQVYWCVARPQPSADPYQFLVGLKILNKLDSGRLECCYVGLMDYRKITMNKTSNHIERPGLRVGEVLLKGIVVAGELDAYSAAAVIDTNSEQESPDRGIGMSGCFSMGKRGMACLTYCTVCLRAAVESGSCP